jgi:hypothetical protein
MYDELKKRREVVKHMLDEASAKIQPIELKKEYVHISPTFSHHQA